MGLYLDKKRLFSMRKSLIICFFCCFFKLAAQPPAIKMLSYIDAYSELAIQQMVAHKIPASVILAQAIFESRNGESDLAKKSNNHFGIKCHLEWGGDTVIKHDDTLNECFRKYLNIEDSYTDHSLFLKSRARYAALFDLPINDYKAWCQGLKTSGYATYAGYAEDLIDIIERAKLYEIDGYAPIQPLNVLRNRNEELKESKHDYTGFTLSEFYNSGLLWLDERDLLIQNLDLIVDRPFEEDEEFAEQ
jgi:hypothetical protein